MMRSRLPLVLAALLPIALAACSKELVCPRGEVACGGRCVSLADDAANCGACGHACGPRALCTAGACGCAPGTADCGGACVDTASDPANCGACGTACAAPLAFCSAAACADACGAGLTACGLACVDTSADRFDCGACGHACAPGETCRAGACGSDLYVACAATDEVVPAAADLTPAGPSRAAGDGPTSLALGSDALYAADNGYGSASSGLPGIAAIPLDTRLDPTAQSFASGDFEFAALHRNLVVVSDDGSNALLVYDPAQRRIIDAVALASGVDPNPQPHGIDFVGDVAYVALSGSDQQPGGQAVAVVDFSGLATCADPAAPACGTGGACDPGRSCVDGLCQVPCGTLLDRIPVDALADAGGKPFPWNVRAVDGRVFVSIGNMVPGSFSPFVPRSPAGHGKLAVIDAAHGNALSSVDLGAGCENPNALAVDGAQLWVTCNWTDSHAVLPVSLGTPPVPGTPVDLGAVAGAAGPIVPGAIAFCGGMGYVGDMQFGTSTGVVARFDPSGATAPVASVVCPTGPYGYAYVGDIACAP